MIAQPLNFIQKIALLLFTTFWITSSAPIDCTLTTSSEGCSQMNGCAWSGNTCQGTYVPSCNPPSCHYIYPIGTVSSSPTGSHDDPFLDFTQAIEKISTQNTILYVAGDPNTQQVVVQTTKRIKVRAFIDMKPLLNTNFTFNLTGAFKEGFDNLIDYWWLSTNQCAVTCDTTGSFKISHASIIGHTFDKRFYMICSEQTSDLVFENIYLIDQLQFHDNQAVFVYKGKGNLHIKNSVFQNTTFGFLMREEANSYFYNNQFKEMHINGQSIQSNGFKFFHLINNTFSGIKPMGPLNEFIQLQSGVLEYMEALFEGNTFTQAFTNVIRIDNIQNVTFSKNKFININYSTPGQKPLLIFRGESSVVLKTYMKDDIFDNITVRGSVIYSENIILNIEQATWTSISKTYNPEYMVQYEAVDLLVNQEVVGTCVMMTNYGILNVKNSKFTNLNSNCLAGRQSKLEIIDVTFNNQELIDKNPTYWEQFNAGVSWISIYEANPASPSIHIERVNFHYNGGIADMGSGVNIRSIGSLDVTIKDSNFTRLSAKNGGGLYAQISLGSLSLQNCIFEHNNAQQNGGGLYVQGKSTNSISYFKNSMIDLTIFNNSAGSNGGGIFIHTTNIDMKNINFLKNRAFNGGGIYQNNLVRASQLTNFQAKDQFKNIQIVNNVASGLGPALKLSFNLSEVFNTSTSLIFIDGNSIELQGNESSRTWGLEQISYHKPTYFHVRIFQIHSIEQTTTSTNFKTLIQSSTLTTLSKEFNHNEIPDDLFLSIKSGHKLPMLLEITVLDQNKDIMVTVNNEAIDFSLSPADSTDVSTKISAFQDSFQNGIVYIKDQIELIGKNQSEATLFIKSRDDDSSPLLKDWGAILNLPIKVKFQPCEIGDIYNPNTLQCITCAPGTYSLANPYEASASCLECVGDAECIRGSMISPKPGYFRYDTNTVNFRKCETDDSCLGGVVENIYHPQGKCQPPYYGNLCSQCDSQSAKFGGVGQCHSCVSEWTYYLKFFLLFAASLVTILATIWLNLRRAILMKVALDTNDDDKKEFVKRSAFNAVVLKIAINFTLIKGVISDYGFKWPTFVNDILSFLLNLMPTSEESFSIDCFIVLITDDYDKVFYIKLISKIFQPITLWIMFLSCYFLLRKCFYRHQKLSSAEIKDRVILILLAVSYMNQTEIITSCLQLFKCSNFSSEDSPQYFLDANPQIQCFTEAHMRWGLGFGITFFFLWGILFPLILFFKIKQVAKDPYKRLRYSFIFAGLHHDKYYWEFVILLRKEIMVLILIFLKAFQTGGQIFLSLVVLFFFTYLQLTRSPFNDRKLNNLEFYSLFSCIIMLIVGYFFHIQDKEGISTASYILSSIAVLTNLIFYILLAYNMIQSFRRNMKRMVSAVKNKVLKNYKQSSLVQQPSQKSIDDGKNDDSQSNAIQAESSISNNDRKLKMESSQEFLLPEIEHQNSLKEQSSLFDNTLSSQKSLDTSSHSAREINSMNFSVKQKSLFGRTLEEKSRKTPLSINVEEEDIIDFDKSCQDIHKENSQSSSEPKKGSEDEDKSIAQEEKPCSNSKIKYIETENSDSKSSILDGSPFRVQLSDLNKRTEVSQNVSLDQEKVIKDIEQDFDQFYNLKKEFELEQITSQQESGSSDEVESNQIEVIDESSIEKPNTIQSLHLKETEEEQLDGNSYEENQSKDL